MTEAFLVLWWVPEGHRPAVAEAIAKLGVLRRSGPTDEAFTFRQSYPAPDAVESPPVNFGDECRRRDCNLASDSSARDQRTVVSARCLCSASVAVALQMASAATKMPTRTLSSSAHSLVAYPYAQGE